MTIQPFANDNASLGIGGLTVENHLDRVVLYGNLELTLDQIGLAYARELKALLDAVVVQLEGEADQLPPQISQPNVENFDTVDNPFL